jgi:hypothetical protein
MSNFEADQDGEPKKIERERERERERADNGD